MLKKRNHRKYVLDKLIQSRGWTKGAELGVLKGDTFLYLLERNPTLHLLGVDTWAPAVEQDSRREEGGRSYKEHDLNGYYLTLEKTILDKGWEDRAFLARTTTTAAAENIADGTFDFVFIDADHTYEGVSADIDAWYPKIRNGGMLLGHDFNFEDFPGVVRAVYERFVTVDHYPDKVWGVVKS